jgi:hypothetical protein
VGALVALSLLAAASPSRADEVSQWNEAFDHGLVSRPHTIAELEVGAIVLPSAPISPAQRGGNLPAGLQIGKGDATVQLGVHVHYRAAPAWSIGAGVLFAPRPTNDTGYGLGGSSGLSRTHSRDYLFVGAEGRYFPLHYKLFEAWVGVQAGGIVVADRFTTDAAGAYSPKIGYPQVNERTEGFAFGGQVGFAYSFAESFTVGFTLRASGWFLPSTPQCSTIGDCATLTSTAAVYEGGLLLGYRLPL